ncbi:Piso0_002960 [Millerozyma farinosa CBS 7064]|uniref:Piso0_002960 protein n=1 Tax=Pichia sorbitophila (strain ATCC MYA-4447 / BCRC 22081 / CBS 7064 / NBRC 10061 / NRRL Y-12695) TaxID=559304 RepID=G8YJY8_PICSO|nr:Piso0_002960 [Millerozyma farinosa CBS 7064]CCE80633.1 Piso0_002960 [Millerozyma farinosa CBS 7064]
MSNNDDANFVKESPSFQEQQRRQIILNSMENIDYLLVIACQQSKSVQQVRYELMKKLMED